MRHWFYFQFWIRLASVAVSGTRRYTVKCVSRLCWCLGLQPLLWWRSWNALHCRSMHSGVVQVVPVVWSQDKERVFQLVYVAPWHMKFPSVVVAFQSNVLPSHGNNLFVDDRKKIFWVVVGRKGGVSGSSVRADWLVAFRQSWYLASRL